VKGRKVWQCLFCKRIFWNISRGQQHQQTCTKKPTARVPDSEGGK
jgi:uncharacterized protein with PIN domain